MTLPLVAYFTSRMGFRVRAGTDKADYQDFIDMMTKLDGAAGLVLCTEATKPSTNLFPGMYIKCEDSGAHYTYGGGSFTLGVYSGGIWTQDNYITAVTPVAGNVFYTGNQVVTDDAQKYTTGASWPHDTVSGRCSVSVPTASTNQRYTADVEIEYGIADASLMNSFGFAVYLTVDGVDTLLGTIDGTVATNAGATLTASAGGAPNIKEFSFSSTLVTASTHTFSIKIKSGHNTGTGPAVIGSIYRYNMVVTLSS